MPSLCTGKHDKQTFYDCMIDFRTNRSDSYSSADVFVLDETDAYDNTNIAYRLVSCDLSRTPNFVDSPAQVIDGQLDYEALDLQLFENASIPNSTSGALWLADIARLEELSQFRDGLDWVVGAGLGEMLVDGKEAVDAGFVSLSLSHVLAGLDEATDVLRHLELNDSVVGALEIVGVTDSKRQVEARVLVLNDLVQGLELLSEHLLVNFYCSGMMSFIVSFSVWMISSPRNKG
jgi:hypothetical protein